MNVENAPLRIAGAPLVEERRLFGIQQRRRVMAFARNDDGKEPLHTAIQTTRAYRIGTDPEGLEGFDIQAGLWLRERPQALEEAINLLVTTQSTGSEGTYKVALNAASDLVIDLSAAVILSVLTSGEWTVACGGTAGVNIASTVLAAGINASVGFAENELLDQSSFAQEQQVAERLTFWNKRLNDGVEPPGLNGTGVKVSARAFVERFLAAEVRREKSLSGKIATFQEGLPMCLLLQAPFEKLKTAIKDSFTVADLGGEGAACAMGVKTLTMAIPAAARRGPGVYSVQFSISRMIDILPKEPLIRDLQAETAALRALVADCDLDAANVSDLALIQRLLQFIRNTDNAALSAAAQAVFRRLHLRPVQRLTGSVFDDIYRDYRMRFAQLPELEVIIVPGVGASNGQPIGDFVLTVGETAIPVSAAASVMAQRSNENAGARAAIKSEGYDMILLNATIPSPER